MRWFVKRSFSWLRAGIVVPITALVLVLGSGCSTVAVHEQRLVAKPGMTFGASPVETPTSNLLGQIEPGSAAAGGAQAAGCTSCR
jgi:hypothetical protein